MTPLLHLQGITKSFGADGAPVLKGISFDIAPHAYVAIMGPSGSGKSTLLQILGCLEKPDSGEYRINGVSAVAADSDTVTALRRDQIGYVFQSFHLLPRKTALENVLLPMRYAGREKNMEARAEELLCKVGLHGHEHKYPAQLSGGMQQRVAIARALANRPALILADEPTGNLDSAMSQDIMTLLGELNAQENTTVILVTHDKAVAAHARRLIEIKDGNVLYDGDTLSGLEAQ